MSAEHLADGRLVDVDQRGDTQLVDVLALVKPGGHQRSRVSHPPLDALAPKLLEGHPQEVDYFFYCFHLSIGFTIVVLQKQRCKPTINRPPKIQ